MCQRAEMENIIRQLNKSVRTLFPGETADVILFGSYARNDETDGSDIDVIYLVDAPRSEIARKNWQLGEAAAAIMLEYGVVVSPIVENRDYFKKNSDVLPFFRNIIREGVRMSA